MEQMALIAERAKHPPAHWFCCDVWRRGRRYMLTLDMCPRRCSTRKMARCKIRRAELRRED